MNGKKYRDFGLIPIDPRDSLLDGIGTLAKSMSPCVSHKTQKKSLTDLLNLPKISA